jgi:hypothetical protein
VTVGRRKLAVAVMVSSPLALLALGIASEQANVFPYLRFAIQRPPQDLPSTRSLPRAEVARGQPTMSLYVDPRHLHDEARGLFTHVVARGRDWERPASVSYFDDGRLLFASEAGVRIHGGISRRISPVQSFKIYFRRDYGADRVRPALLFDGRADPLRRLIAHNDLRADQSGRYWHFVNPLAYDISERIGAKVPWTHPVRFFLNGEWQGVYVLTEKIDINIDPRYLVAHYGHDEFETTNRDFDRLWIWLQRNTPWTLNSVSQMIDMDNLTRWFLSVLFCATEDPLQGAQLRDRRAPDARWFWINWDMDHSFMDYNRQVAVPWEHDTFRVVFERPGERRRGRFEYEVRSILLTTLVAEDRAYREYFQKVFDEVMNYRLKPEFLTERFEHYRRLTVDYGLEDVEYLDLLRGFLTHRPAFLRALAEQYLNTDPSTTLRLHGPPGVTLSVDGFEVARGFEGRYFPGRTITVSVGQESRSRLAYWRVNGARMDSDGRSLSLQTTRDLEVEAVLR